MKIFVDSSAWIAFFNKTDDFHKASVSFFKKKPRLISSNIVLHETIAHLQSHVNRKTAETAAEFILNSLLTELIFIAEKEEKQSFKKYKKGQRKISFVDWTNFVLMKENNIRKIFAFDTHFKKMGLQVVP